jgi:type IV secretory pathway VirB4 component
MDKEPIIPQRVEHWTLEQLFERSLDELRKSLGVPKVIEADKIKQVTDDSKVIKDTKEGN